MTSILSLLVFIISYVSYSLLSHSRYFHERLLQKFGEDRMPLQWIVFRRLVGFVCLGLFPGILAGSLSLWSSLDLGLSLRFSSSGLWWTLGTVVCVLGISYFSARNPKNFFSHPQIRVNPWTIGTITLNAVSWLVYLVGYEFLFRGLLLHTFDSALGLWPAVFMTTFLYVLVHVPKGLEETLGALPFGIVLALLTMEAGSIWPAIAIHAVLALSFDHFALQANPDLHINLWGKKSE